MPDETPVVSSITRRILPVVALLLALVLAGDLALQLALPKPDHAPARPPESTRDLRAQLSRAASDPRRPILLIGDSVLAGSALAPHSEGWRSQRVLDYLRREAHPDEAVAFHQIATDALLPTDLERVIAELDHRDPEHRVELVAEINLRFLSPHYRERLDCTRDWYCELPGLDPDGSQLAHRYGRALDALRNGTPIRRHLNRLGAPGIVPDPEVFAARRRERVPPDALAGLARIRAHYRVKLSGRSAQLDALERVLRRLAENGRPALFFATPLRDSFIEELLPRPQLATLYGALARWIHQRGAENVGFLSLDHPLFGDDHFVDHVHLTPRGNRLLAVNLLAELGVRLLREPAPTELAYDHGINRTLVNSADVGNLDGPPWMARLRKPGGIAFDPAGSRLVIAEPERHTLRILRGNMRTVEHWTGRPGKPGGRNGPLQLARFDRPHSPVVAGGAVYLLDGAGSRIREIRDGRVRTAAQSPSPSWLTLASDGQQVFALGVDGSVRRLRDGKLEEVLRASQKKNTRLTQLAVSPQGRLFVATRKRIWQGSIPETGSIDFEGLEILVPGKGKINLPAKRATFPMSADEIGFSNITTLEYVERYEGLLVVDETSAAARTLEHVASERAHLRFVHPASRRVFPWLKPFVNGRAYFPSALEKPHRASAFHVSSVALDPSTLDLYLLERERSRLLRIGDGLFGASLISDPNARKTSPFGSKSSREILMAFQPQGFRDGRAELAGYRGNLIGIFAGSSLIMAADGHGYYSLARALELALSQRLSLSEKLNVDLYVLSHPGADIPRSVEMALQFMKHHFVPDFVIIDANELVPTMMNPILSGQAIRKIAELGRMAREHGFALLVVDNSGIGALMRDGLLPRSQELQSFFAALRGTGFDVVEPNPQLISALLDVSPWGNPPHGNYQHHGSPQAIDRTAMQLASQLAPRLAGHFDERGQRVERTPLVPRPGGSGGLQALLSARDRRSIRRAPILPPHLTQVELRNDRLEALIDLGSIEALGLDVPASIEGVRSVARAFVLEDVRGQLVDELHIRFVRFSNYDEYGLGTLEGAETVFEFTLNRSTIGQLLTD